MLMYVNYYNRYEKTEDENPTIGILLCNEKSDKMVEMILPEDSNIYASKYQLYLPDKKLLQEKMLEWLEEVARRAPRRQKSRRGATVTRKTTIT